MTDVTVDVLDTEDAAVALDRAVRKQLMENFETDQLLNTKEALVSTTFQLAENNAAFALTLDENDPRMDLVGRLDGFFADIYYLLTRAQITLPDGDSL